MGTMIQLKFHRANLSHNQFRRRDEEKNGETALCQAPERNNGPGPHNISRRRGARAVRGAVYVAVKARELAYDHRWRAAEIFPAVTDAPAKVNFFFFQSSSLATDIFLV